MEEVQEPVCKKARTDPTVAGFRGLLQEEEDEADRRSIARLMPGLAGVYEKRVDLYIFGRECLSKSKRKTYWKASGDTLVEWAKCLRGWIVPPELSNYETQISDTDAMGLVVRAIRNNCSAVVQCKNDPAALSDTSSGNALPDVTLKPWMYEDDGWWPDQPPLGGRARAQLCALIPSRGDKYEYDFDVDAIYQRAAFHDSWLMRQALEPMDEGRMLGPDERRLTAERLLYIAGRLLELAVRMERALECDDERLFCNRTTWASINTQQLRNHARRLLGLRSVARRVERNPGWDEPFGRQRASASVTDPDPETEPLSVGSADPNSDDPPACLAVDECLLSTDPATILRRIEDAHDRAAALGLLRPAVAGCDGTSVCFSLRIFCFGYLMEESMELLLYKASGDACWTVSEASAVPDYMPYQPETWSWAAGCRTGARLEDEDVLRLAACAMRTDAALSLVASDPTDSIPDPRRKPRTSHRSKRRSERCGRLVGRLGIRASWAFVAATTLVSDSRPFTGADCLRVPPLADYLVARLRAAELATASSYSPERPKRHAGVMLLEKLACALEGMAVAVRRLALDQEWWLREVVPAEELLLRRHAPLVFDSAQPNVPSVDAAA